jgi:hypothetical protein
MLFSLNETPMPLGFKRQWYRRLKAKKKGSLSHNLYQLLVEFFHHRQRR